MSDANLTTANAYLKEVYTPVNALEVMYHDNPFLALVPKDESFTGSDVKQPVIFANPSGQAVDFASAQAAAQGSSSVAFILNRNSNYGYATIRRELLLATVDDKGAFLRATKPEFMGAMNRVKRVLALYLYRTGTGSIGRVGSVVNNGNGKAAISLLNPRDVKNFEKNDSLMFSTSDGGGTTRTQSGATITNLDRVGGVITLSVPFNAGWSNGSISTGDYIYYNAALVTGGAPPTVLHGLQAWLSGSGATSTPYLGVDRTQDNVRLAGLFEDNSAYPIEEGLLNLATDIADLGDGHPDHALITPAAYNNLVKELGSKVRYTEAVTEKGGVKFGFVGVEINGPRGPIKVIPDYNCPSGVGFVLTLSSWKFRSLRQAPHWITDDNLDMLRLATSDSFEARFASYAELGCEAPGYNGQTLLAA
jgi:hypothetical protein